ncbi:KUP/HAK/KT family potassium transporter [Bifidobacterium sp. ESL0784]|uniref:KUP/HAK/KT family potassium transporter n=1 Tax=Bifidobacterium sp. ESL0784 TaxID=2983231 RepID=UPI0023F6A9C0|nr:KUP/HAK/KT family potassium transporter [Bifidobacterium sp. ESL0784]MDF7640188.1 KUP/HAK/KT family potassium transporter [Bifidobacterium sp. ESL0784]
MAQSQDRESKQPQNRRNRRRGKNQTENSGVDKQPTEKKAVRKLVRETDKASKVVSKAEKQAVSAEEKALKAEKRAVNAEKKALLRADTFTNAPKVSRDTLTREEREEIAKHDKEEQEEAEKLTKASSHGPIGRWWRKMQSSQDKVTLGMAIVALGVVYGDIGTSPLYTSQTFIVGQGGFGNIDRPAILGLLSLVFWSITLITTVKYVLVAMRIDNKGEGGIFALFSLIRHHGKWLVIPAMLGGAAFLADSVLTPAVSISSAVEGLKTIPLFEPVFHENTSLTLVITVVIIVILFCVQSRGTERIGKVFGSVVMVWFAFLAITGIVNISGDWSIFEAINPVYGIEFLFSKHNLAGLAIMGTVFLSTTGAEALYSDMGHVGRGNIYFTWPFIFVALVFNYFGQGAWMLRNQGNTALGNVNPFFEMMSPNVRYVGVILSVAAGVIASQALITGAFTMVSEATGLNWMPHLQVRYPARTRGQLYIPVVNVVLCVATLTVLAIFKDSEHISAAYGLALTVTMITTTILLTVYLWFKHNRVFAIVFFVVFIAIQTLFFVASMAKFLHGGWFTMLLTALILLIMITWNDATKIERSQRRHMKPRDFKPALAKLHDDFRIPYFADNIVYLTSDWEMHRLDTDIFFSIFADHPKRARAWWAVSVVTTDEPFTREYSVEDFGTDYIFRVRIRLGFKVSQSIPAYIHQIMHDLSASGDLPEQKSVYPKVDADPDIGTVRYVLVHKALMPESKLTARESLSLKMKYAIRHVAGSPVKWFGLAPYNPVVEVQPLFVSTRRPPRLKRVSLRASTGKRRVESKDSRTDKATENKKGEAGASAKTAKRVTLNEVKAKAENETLSESEKAKALRAAKTLKAVRAVQADKALRVSQVAKQELANLAKKGTASMEDTGEQTKIMQRPDTSGTGSEKQS